MALIADFSLLVALWLLVWFASRVYARIRVMAYTSLLAEMKIVKVIAKVLAITLTVKVALQIGVLIQSV